MTNLLVQAVVFVLLAFLLWETDNIRRTQRLLARRILGMEMPELSDKLLSSTMTSLQREDLLKLIPVLRKRLPELSDTKRLLAHLESRGLTNNEIRLVIEILNSEQPNPKGAAPSQ